MSLSLTKFEIENKLDKKLINLNGINLEMQSDIENSILDKIENQFFKKGFAIDQKSKAG